MDWSRWLGKVEYRDLRVVMRRTAPFACCCVDTDTLGPERDWAAATEVDAEVSTRNVKRPLEIPSEVLEVALFFCHPLVDGFALESRISVA
jgi:hypothetical protein